MTLCAASSIALFTYVARSLMIRVFTQEADVVDLAVRVMPAVVACFIGEIMYRPWLLNIVTDNKNNVACNSTKKYRNAVISEYYLQGWATIIV